MVPQLRRLNICVGGVDPLLMLKVWGLNPALSENTTFLPYFFNFFTRTPDENHVHQGIPHLSYLMNLLNLIE